MTFGLWFEPEMISEVSELYKAHPDWCMRLPDRPYCRGRNQLILDLSRDDVEQYLETVVDNPPSRAELFKRATDITKPA